MTTPSLETTVTLAPADEWDFADTELLEATVKAVRDRRPELAMAPAAMSFETTIPRQVGLSGSSAIIMAALRALATRAGTEWNLVELARTTLEVETHVLGWTAGPQDRVVQAYTGLMDMDFATPWDPSLYHRLSTQGLPPLFIAWNTSTGAASDVVHTNVRQRWLDGDVLVRSTLTRFAELAAAGRQHLDAGAAAQHWPALMDEAFELRSKIWTITDIDRALIDAGQGAGAGVAFAGSGGAVVGSLPGPVAMNSLRTAYESIGAGFVVIHPGANA